MPPKKVISVENKEAVFWSLKKPDGEPLLRADVQYQLLQDIFNDRSFRFTAPVDQATEPGPIVYLNFDQLYLEAILSSLKTTTFLRQKLIENPTFSIAFCKLCLLINVGRINTTLAFYPNMKTALRTYHSIPSLQQDEISRKDLSDAPRIKAVLKACFLDWEVTDQPANLRAVAMKAAAPNKLRGPPTTVVTAIFLLFNESTWVTQRYLPANYDLHDLFLPSSMASNLRANAFLSLIHRILENPQFIKDFDTPPPIILSPPIILRMDGGEKENIDPEEELAYAEEMRVLRKEVYKNVPAYTKRDEENVLKEARKADAVSEPSTTRKRRRVVSSSSSQSYSKLKREEEMNNVIPQILPEGWQDDDWTSDIPQKSSLAATWSIIKRDQVEDRDPEYESDEEALPFELLLRRTFLTFRNPVTGIRGPITDMKKEIEELKRRKEVHISVLASVNEDVTNGDRDSSVKLGSAVGGGEVEAWYPGDEMEMREDDY